MALQVPSGLITGVSGGGITSGTTAPVIAYPIPVVIVGANGAGASGNHSITDSSGLLNVAINSGVAVSVSGDIVLVISGGAIQVQTSGAAGSQNVVVATSGQNSLLGLSGALLITFAGLESGVGTNSTAFDGNSNILGLGAVSFNLLFNGTTWDRTRTLTGSSGGSLGVLATQPVGYSYSNPTGAGVTNIKSGAGFLHAININQTGGSGQQVQIRDSVSGVAGTLIGTIVGTASGATVGTFPGPIHLLYDLLFTSGLVISTSGTLWDLTVTWRTATS